MKVVLKTDERNCFSTVLPICPYCGNLVFVVDDASPAYCNQCGKRFNFSVQTRKVYMSAPLNMDLNYGSWKVGDEIEYSEE